MAQRTADAVVIAQGRPQPMLSVAELPEAIDSPDADGPLSVDEAERWELCRRSFEQFAQAWWVMATAMDVALRGRLWRRDYATAEAFIRDVAGMSTSNAYRQIAGARVAAILARPGPLELLAHPAFEQGSNTLSRARDSGPATVPEGLTISQRAAEALTPIRADYDDETAAVVYRAVAEATGRDSVPGTVIARIVRQLPRRADEDLDHDALCELARILVVGSPRSPDDDPVRRFAEHVDAARDFAASTRGMPAAYRAAVAADPAVAERLAARLKGHLTRAAKNFPDA
ncbi:hypothetical protein [Embleya sp. NPDC020886]|uniref:hypothetical protein n=1 Tax=Embleya sp. NPDC020886 TaxID=3363980 RepID=UPI0037B00107